MTHASRWLFALALLGASLLPREAGAQSAKASAEALFEEGRRLVGENKIADACPKFADSQRLDPSSSTLLNLASCYEKVGRSASAWATYQEAASLAAANGRNDHLEVARKRATAIQPTLVKATVVVKVPVEGLNIRRDGVQVTRAEWGLAVPIDPGPHTYVIEAPKYKPAKLTVEVPKPAEDRPPDNVTVEIPALERAPEPPHPLVAQPGAGPRSDPALGRRQRTLALVAGGLGVVGVGIGAGFIISAKTLYDESLSQCPNSPNRCTQAGVNQRDDAITRGNVATVGFIAGGTLAAIGLVTYVTAPSSAASSSSASIEVGPTAGGLAARGRW